MTNQKFPPRLHIILARQANTAIVIRRGPSKWTSTFSWDRGTDEVKLGQWLHGRIYERRCDLSPDGKHFLYFAMNGHWASESKGSWIAISRVPYLKAIGFWPKGDCWHGGGLFIDNKTYWLNSGYGVDAERVPPGLKLRQEPPFETHYGGECPGVYYPRLLRDGWKLAEEKSDSRSNQTHTFEKALPHGWVLRKIAHSTLDHPPGRGCYYDEHWLLNEAQDLLVDGSSWEWCDWDPLTDKLVWARDGVLYRTEFNKQGMVQEQVIHDFNPYEFEPVVAPY